uniref:HAT C-terminal dimerisation domain-containing protein n=1 Tax=Plectus sambesii TaxID=2011161 RepID=A0A914VKZ7_9BILA
MVSRFEKILNPSAYGFDATFVMATFLSPSLALILDDYLMECAKENLKKILTAEMKGAVTVAASAHSSPSELSEEQPSSLVSLFPDLMAMAQAKRSTEGVMRGLGVSLQAEKILVAYTNDLPSSAHCADSLRFWQVHSKKYGVLSDIDLQLLTVHASSATIEQVFSIAGDVADVKRNRLCPKQIEIETMLRFNRKFIPL